MEHFARELSSYSNILKTDSFHSKKGETSDSKTIIIHESNDSIDTSQFLNNIFTENEEVKICIELLKESNPLMVVNNFLSFFYQKNYEYSVNMRKQLASYDEV
jgi:hypothetical protein